MDKILSILEENNRLLKRILSILLLLTSDEARAQNDIKQFSINVAADIFVELLENNQELKTKLKNNFKL